MLPLVEGASVPLVLLSKGRFSVKNHVAYKVLMDRSSLGGGRFVFWD